MSLGQPASSALWLTLQVQHPARRKLDAHVGQFQCSTRSFFNVPRSVIFIPFSKLNSVIFQCVLKTQLCHFQCILCVQFLIFNAFSVLNSMHSKYSFLSFSMHSLGSILSFSMLSLGSIKWNLNADASKSGSGRGRYAFIVPVVKMLKIDDFWDFQGGPSQESLKIQVLGEVVAPS